jgi:hypothetical protein
MANPVDPANLAKNGSEHGEQVALFCALSQKFNEYPELKLAFAIPNGGLRDKRTAGALRAEGVKSGVPDIFLPVARGVWHGLFVELKRPKSVGKAEGTVSNEQKEYIAELQKAGYGAVVCVGWEQARDTILAYLNWQG